MEILSQVKEVGIAIFVAVGAFYLLKYVLARIETVTLETVKSNKEVFNALMDQMKENQKDYRSYVEQNNHQKTELVQETVQVMVEIKGMIGEHTKMIEKVGDKLDRILQK